MKNERPGICSAFSVAVGLPFRPLNKSRMQDARKAQARRVFPIRDRITSYNVCYTKLLRTVQSRFAEYVAMADQTEAVIAAQAGDRKDRVEVAENFLAACNALLASYNFV